MNAVEIEEAVSDLATKPFDNNEFQFYKAFRQPRALAEADRIRERQPLSGTAGDPTKD